MNWKAFSSRVILITFSAIVTTQSPLYGETLLPLDKAVDSRNQQLINNDDVPQKNTIQLVKGSGPEVFLIQDGERRWITDSKTFDAYGFKYNEVEEIFDYQLDNYEEGTPISKNGTLLKGSSSEVYIIIDGTRRLVRESIFEKYQFRREDINSVTDEKLLSIPKGEDFQ
jgi:hypothetical protein